MTSVNEQKKMLEMASKLSSSRDATFFELLSCVENPLTAKDLERNIERRPELWKRYEGFLPYLRGREAPQGQFNGISSRDRDFLHSFRV